MLHPASTQLNDHDGQVFATAERRMRNKNLPTLVFNILESRVSALGPTTGDNLIFPRPEFVRQV